jgi:hypothetical protein
MNKERADAGGAAAAEFARIIDPRRRAVNAVPAGDAAGAGDAEEFSCACFRELLTLRGGPFRQEETRMSSSSKPITERYRRLAAILILVAVSGAGQLDAQMTNTNDTDEDRMRLGTTPVKPFRIIGNIYYVGAVRISSFLIKTSDGYILMDTG